MLSVQDVVKEVITAPLLLSIGDRSHVVVLTVIVRHALLILNPCFLVITLPQLKLNLAPQVHGVIFPNCMTPH
jgi:hypothetical protein